MAASGCCPGHGCEQKPLRSRYVHLCSAAEAGDLAPGRKRSSRCHLSPRRSARRQGLTNSRPNLTPHCRIVSWLTAMPRDASIASTIRSLRRKPELQPHRMTDHLRWIPAGRHTKGRDELSSDLIADPLGRPTQPPA